jgi:hypothetical protein
MGGPEGVCVDSFVVWTSRPLAASLSSETRKIGVYLYRNGLRESDRFYEPGYAQRA